MGYSLIVTDLLLAPAIPSNTARTGAIVFPILRSIARSYGSEPHDGTARRIGAFLIQTSFQGTVITSAMFLTAMAANPLAAKLAAHFGVEITWEAWALAAAVPGLVSLAVVPWVLYKTYPPEIRDTPEAAQIAIDRLAEMGRLKRREWIMLGTFTLLLLLWILGGTLGIQSTTAALLGLAVLLMTGVLSWEDLLQQKAAWNTLVWFATLLMMATHLNDLGLIPWFGEAISSLVAGTSWVKSFLILSLIYFYSHYLFCQQHRPYKLHVRCLPVCSHCSRHTTNVGGSGTGFFQQSVQQHDPLRYRARSCALRVGLRGDAYLVETGRAHQHHQHHHLAGYRRPVVENSRHLVT